MATIERTKELLSAGDDAPDGELTNIEGERIHIADYWQNQPVVLVFLRHLGCVFCREQVALLRRDYGKFQAVGTEVICIAQGDYKTGKAFSLFFDLPFPLLMCGDDLAIYKSYGLAKGTTQQLFGVRSWTRGFIASMRGHIQGKIVGDGFQMGGAFVIDSHGTIRLVYLPDDASDHPDNRALLQTAQDLGTENAN
jgi:peroxiredoxin